MTIITERSSKKLCFEVSLAATINSCFAVHKLSTNTNLWLEWLPERAIIAITALVYSKHKSYKVVLEVVLILEWRHSQVVRQRSAKPLSPGSNPGVALFYIANNYPKPLIYQVFQGFGVIVNVP